MENNHPYIVIALPCYNEAENIPGLLENFERLNLVYGKLFETKVVLIDDASKDNTQEVLKSKKWNLDLTIILHPENRNLTGGINTAFAYYEEALKKENPPLALGLMDGDNSHPASTIPSMMEKMMQGYDVVVASRYRPGSQIVGVSGFRQILSLGLAMLFKMLHNLPGIRDMSCGFRLYSPRIIKLIKKDFPSDVVFEKSFASMVEILLRCHKAGAVMGEVPFLLRYDLKMGLSKMDFKKTIMGNLKLLTTLKSVK